MTISFYLKLAVAIFFVAMPYFASATVEPEKISPAVRYVADQYGERLSKFNSNPLGANTYEHHTHNIQRTLKNVDERRHASDKEKELILKAVMGSVVIHENDPTYRLPTHRLKEGNSRFRHFEILRLTEKLAVGLMAQLGGGFMDITALTGYENLYGFSGKNKGVFESWFKDVVNKHNHGLAQRITSSLQKKHNDGLGIALFGDIATHHMMGYCAVFVSTYNTSAFWNCVLIHLSDRGERQRYIVIENPNHDGGQYTIRAHPIVNGDSGNANPDANIKIEHGSAPITINDSDKSIQTHPRDYTDKDGVKHAHTVFSPDNKHLSGIDERPLTEGEFFSFVSKVDGIGDCTTKVDTLHLITGKIGPIVKLAKKSSNFGGFLQELSRVHEIFGADTLSHWAKMMAFTVGTI